MEITTSGAECGGVALDAGSRPGRGPHEGGDGFAAALDREMGPKPEAPRAKEGDRVPNDAAPAQGTREARSPEAAAGETKEAESSSPTKRPDGPAEGEEGPQEGATIAFPQWEAETEIVLPDGAAAAPVVLAEMAESGNELPPPGLPVALPDEAAPPEVEVGPRARTVAPTVVHATRAEAPALAEDPPPVAEEGAFEPLPERASMREPPRGAPTAAAAREAVSATGQMVRELQAAPPPMNPPATGSERIEAFTATLAALHQAAPPASDTALAHAQGLPMGSMPASSGAPPAAPTATHTAVEVPLGQPGWDQAVGERVVWLARNGLPEARIELHPRELGPVEVRVSVQQDQASVAFTAHTPAAREALEAALPRLREMMADNGLNLVQSEVSQHSPRQGHEGWGGGERRAAVHGIHGEGNGPAPIETPLSTLVGVDYYA